MLNPLLTMSKPKWLSIFIQVLVDDAHRGEQYIFFTSVLVEYINNVLKSVLKSN